MNVPLISWLPLMQWPQFRESYVLQFNSCFPEILFVYNDPFYHPRKVTRASSLTDVRLITAGIIRPELEIELHREYLGVGTGHEKDMIRIGKNLYVEVFTWRILDSTNDMVRFIREFHVLTLSNYYRLIAFYISTFSFADNKSFIICERCVTYGNYVFTYIQFISRIHSDSHRFSFFLPYTFESLRVFLLWCEY